MFDNRDPDSLPFDPESSVVLLDGVRYAVAQARVNWNDPYGEWTLVVLEDLSRTAPRAASVRIGAAATGLAFLIGILLLKMLQGVERQRFAKAQLEAHVLAQTAASEKKSLLAAAAVRMQQTNSLTELAKRFFVESYDLVGTLQGALYILHNAAETLHLVGSYACAEPPAATVAVGVGLLGQCAIERCRMLHTAPASGFMMIHSGLGDTVPAALTIVPVMLGDRLLGVVEVAFLSLPDEETLRYLDELVTLLAMNIEIVGRTTQTQEMLSVTLAAEQAGSEQIHFQQALIDAMPYPVFYMDADSRFIGFNHAYEQAFAVNRTHLMGKRIVDLEHFPETNRIAFQVENEAIIASAGTLEREMAIPYADGLWHDTLYYVSGFLRFDGTPGGLVGTFVDISSLKNAERELARFADIERFNRLALGREERILALKCEVNELCKAAGRTTPYTTTLIETIEDHEMNPHPDYATALVGDDRAWRLDDLVDLEELQQLLSSFCEAVGVASAIIDLDGKVLAAARWQSACTNFHRVHPDSRVRCTESDAHLAMELREGREFAMYRCKNGMSEAAAPIIVDGRYLANIFIGHYHLSPPDPDFFQAQCRQFGYDKVNYLAAIAAAPLIEEGRLPTILSFLSDFARIISTQSLARRRSDLAQQILAQQADLLKRERVAALSLAEDAEQAHRALTYMAKGAQS
jgi:PAS domain S-box-containing protein